MGNFRYFTFTGNLRRQSWLGQRFPDRILGFITAIWKSGPDAIDDHKMEFYLANLDKALAKEEEEKRLEIEQRALAGELVEDMKQRLRGKKPD